jgi:hypothetical protein
VPSSKKERKKREQSHVAAEYYFNIQRNAFFESIRIKDLSLINQYYESELQSACLEVLNSSNQVSGDQIADQTIKHESIASTLVLSQPNLKIRQKIRQVLELDDIPNIEPKPGQRSVIFTSINLRYLPKALVLAKSLKKFHPDWMFHILLNDALPDQPKTLPNVDVIYPIRGLNIENFHSWCFRHDVVELCTATKPFYVKQLLEKGWENVFYFDPDTKIFQSLDLLTNQLESSNVLLTPHCTEQAKSLTEIHYNEISCLAHGIYNLGFAGFKNTKIGIDVANFWARRMLRHCLDDHARGLFTDQKWINHVPVFFDNVCILKHKGCNTASWNIASRPISRRNGKVYAGDDPLLFFHFSGYDKNVPRKMFDIYGSFNGILDELITEYDAETTAFSEKYKIWKSKWALAYFDNGNVIEQQVRRYYRENHEMELIFTAPFYARTTPSFSQWLQNHGHEQIARAAPPAGFIRQFF